jgi:hypothetical protein
METLLLSYLVVVARSVCLSVKLLLVFAITVILGFSVHQIQEIKEHDDVSSTVSMFHCNGDGMGKWVGMASLQPLSDFCLSRHSTSRRRKAISRDKP